MPDPFTLLAGAVTAGSGLASLFGGSNKSFQDTDYGKLLKRLAEKGIYSGDTLARIMGQVGRETGNAAQQAKTDFKGNLISQGMGGSIAGQRDLADIDVQRMDQLRKVMTNLMQENERLKSEFGLKYAQAGSEYDLGQQGRRQDALSDLFSTSGMLFYDQLTNNPQGVKNQFQMRRSGNGNGIDLRNTKRYDFGYRNIG